DCRLDSSDCKLFCLFFSHVLLEFCVHNTQSHFCTSANRCIVIRQDRPEGIKSIDLRLAVYPAHNYLRQEREIPTLKHNNRHQLCNRVWGNLTSGFELADLGEGFYLPY